MLRIGKRGPLLTCTSVRKVKDGNVETLTYCDVPTEHWIAPTTSTNGSNGRSAAACVWSGVLLAAPKWAVQPQDGGEHRYLNVLTAIVAAVNEDVQRRRVLAPQRT